jgi:hypothetical protein
MADDDEAQLRRFAALMLDLRPFWPKVVPKFIEWMRKQFESEGEYLGAPWAPLSPAYAARKAVLRPGRSILIFDGNLRKAASQPQRDAKPRDLTLTINDPKAAWHQEGTPRMPARPLIPEQGMALMERDLNQLMEEYVNEMASRLGL